MLFYILATIFVVIFGVSSSVSFTASQDVASARQESEVVWYTNIPMTDAKMLADAFESEYPFLKVKIVGGDSERLATRLAAETKYGMHLSDVHEFQIYTIPYLKEENLIEPYCSLEAKFYLHGHKDEECFWTDASGSWLTPAYNTEKISQKDLPQLWEDFLAPKFKKQISTPAHGVLYQGLIQRWGIEKTREYFNKLAQNTVNLALLGASQGILPRLTAGDISIAFMSHNLVEVQKEKGAPIDWISAIQPIVSNMQVVSLSRNAPHPESAKLFIDFLLSKKGQEIKQKQYRVSGRRDMPCPFKKVDCGKLDVVVVQPAESSAEFKKIQDEFREIILR